MYLYNTLIVLIVAIVCVFFIRSQKLHQRTTFNVQSNSFCTTNFKKTEEVFRSNLASGLFQGLSFAVYHNGQLVCDLWGGITDERSEHPWQYNSLVPLFSAAHVMAVVCVGLLMDRGLLAYHQPIEVYWPDFKLLSNQNFTIEHLLSHQTNLHRIKKIDNELSVDLAAEDIVSKFFTASKFDKNSELFTSSFHAATFLPLINQLVKNVDIYHRSLNEFFQQEVAIPYNLDLHFGVESCDHWRVVHFHSPTPWDVILSLLLEPIATLNVFDIFNPFSDLLSNPSNIIQTVNYRVNWPNCRAMPCIGICGFGTARDLAQLYNLLTIFANQTSVEAPLLSPTTLSKLFSPLTNGVDEVLNINISWAGGILAAPSFGWGEGKFGHIGFGGQLGMVDTNNNLSWAFLTNYPSLRFDDKDFRYQLLYQALLQDLST